MRIKPDRVEYRHKKRRRELKLIFGNCPPKLFSKALEVGAGDGYQSTILTRYADNLICTEYFVDKLPQKNIPGVTYLACDAEKIDSYFKEKEFDMIFSSSMIEHLSDREAFFRGAQKILKDDGLIICTVPNRLWKLSQMIFHHFNYLILFLEHLGNSPFKKLRGVKENIKNYKINPKSKKKYNLLRRIIWPVPHGTYESNLQEFISFGRRNWIDLFRKNNLLIVKIIKGPISSGYRLGFERISRLLKKIGFCSIYIFILTKEGKKSKYLKYLK